MGDYIKIYHMNTFIRWLRTTPTFPDNNQQRRAQLLNALLLFVSTAIFLNMGVGQLFVSGNTWNPTFDIALIGTMVGMLFLLKRGYFTATSVAFSLIIWLAVTYFLVAGGGIFNTYVTGYIVVVFITGLLLGRYAAVGCMLATIISLLLFNDGRVLEDLSTTQPTLALIVIVITASVITYLADQTLSQTLTTLQEKNAQLEKEIQERKRIECVFRESEKRYRHLLEHLPIAITVSDAETHEFLYLNPEATKLLGESEDGTLISEDYFAFVMPDEAGVEMPNEGTSFQERTVIRVDGSKVPTEVSTMSITYDKRPATLSAIHDITDRKQAQDLLEASEKQYRELLNQMPLAVVITSQDDYRLIAANAAAATLVEVDNVKQLISQSLGDFVPAASFRDHPERLQQIEQGLPTSADEFDIFTAKGNALTVEVMTMPVIYDGEPALLNIIQDVTQRKQEQQAKLNAEIYRIELDKERKLIQLRQTFIDLMSHQFRTPITVAVSSKEILENYWEKLTPEKRQKHFKKMDMALRDMSQLLDNILVFSKATSGLLDFAPIPLYLDIFCNDLIEEFLYPSDRRVRVAFENTQQWEKALFDENLLRHIIQKLLTNAARNTPENGEIRFRLRYDDTNNEAVIEIMDQSKAMSDKALAERFEPFFPEYQASQLEGAQFDLAIARYCAEAHKGHLSYAYIPDSGTVFTVHLPITPLPAPE